MIGAKPAIGSEFLNTSPALGLLRNGNLIDYRFQQFQRKSYIDCWFLEGWRGNGCNSFFGANEGKGIGVGKVSID